jgi:Family of unknown function (DUF6067)/Hypothetical glycosyl hydrolase 6
MRQARAILPFFLFYTFQLAGLAKGVEPIPPPFTPIHASPAQLRCLGRTMQFGDLLLPRSIDAAGQPLLANPVRIVSEPNLLEGLRGRANILKKSASAATWLWTGESSLARVEASLSAECDGFCWYEVELSPKQPVTIRSLELVIPRRPSTARYVHTANFTWSHFSQGLAEAEGNWAGAFVPYVWLGDEERGLAWCAESSQGWSLKDPSRAVQIETQTNQVCLRVHVLDHEQEWTQPLKLRFGLQASPVKPVSLAWRANARILHDINFAACRPDKAGKVLLDTLQAAGVKTVVFHDGWTDYYGKVSTPYGEQLRELINACHQRGMRLLVYIGYGLACRAPELQGHHDEWSVLPLIPWTTPYRTEFREFDATCPRSGWAEWLIKGVDRLFTEYELDGLYFDGTSEAWRCENPAHGCGWKDSGGRLHPDYPILAARHLMRQLADTVHRHRPNAILDAHMSGNLTLPTLSFCDSYWNGEQFEGYTAKDNFEVPLHAFRTEFMGYAHGLNAEFLCYVKRPFTMEEAIALAWLHGVEVRPYPDTISEVSPIWRAMDSFGAAQAKWLPYWKDAPARADNESVKLSAYSRAGRALLFISHLKREPVTSSIYLDRRRLGLKPGTLLARDALSGDDITIQNDSLPVKFKGMSYKVVEVFSESRRAAR